MLGHWILDGPKRKTRADGCRRRGCEARIGGRLLGLETLLDLPDKVRVKTLGEGRPLRVQLTVSEPATVTVEILNKKNKVLRTVVLDRATAGSFVAQISLTHLRGQLTFRVTATDLDGASTVVEQRFKAK